MPKSLFRKFTKKFFIITNCIVAVLFLLGCYGGYCNPQTWWPLGFLTLGAFYFLLLLVLFVLFWLFVKARWALISVITLLLCYQPVTEIVPLRLAAAFQKEKTTGTLRILSWNVEHFDILEHKTHPEKKQQMLDLIKEYNPDIACFQEMVGSDSNSSAINYIPDIVQQLSFSGYHYSYNRKLDFDGKHHFGIITFSKLPIVQQQTVKFYPYDYNSIFQYTDVLQGNDTVRVFNIHLQSLKFSADNLRYIDDPEINDESDIKKSRSVIGKLKRGFLKRKEQAGRIRTEMDKSPYPLIVCGDFNDVPNSYAYNSIGSGLQNAFAEKGSGIGRTFSGISPTLRIDNIFTAKNFTVQQYTRITKKLSDHFPIFADVQLKK
jgi:endonuclease/exonuclease/phosphatase family metal-dependent hydrolase